MALENGLFSTEEFAKFSAKHVMFLHITTRIPGHPDDRLLIDMGGRGFPTLLALDSGGEIVARPRGRGLGSFRDAMEQAAESVAKSRKIRKQPDQAALAMEFLRKLKLDALQNPAKDRAAYIACRDAMNELQRKLVERSLPIIELTRAFDNAQDAEIGTAKHDRAMLTMLAAKQKLGGKWPMTAITNRVLIQLMGWAEQQNDPQLFATLLEDFIQVRRALFAKQEGNEKFIQKHRARLERLWKGIPPLRQKRTRGKGR